MEVNGSKNVLLNLDKLYQLSDDVLRDHYKKIIIKQYPDISDAEYQRIKSIFISEMKRRFSHIVDSVPSRERVKIIILGKKKNPDIMKCEKWGCTVRKSKTQHQKVIGGNEFKMILSDTEAIEKLPDNQLHINFKAILENDYPDIVNEETERVKKIYYEEIKRRNKIDNPRKEDIQKRDQRLFVL
jgi:hypothetical protein